MSMIERLRGLSAALRMEYGDYPEAKQDAADRIDAILAESQAGEAVAVTNSPIGELLLQYAEECCPFDDLAWVREAAQRIVATMPDSQARCLLHVLATTPPAPSAAGVAHAQGLDILARGWFHRRGDNDYDIHDISSGAGKDCKDCVPCVIIKAPK